jgi:hypothetical protein
LTSQTGQDLRRRALRFGGGALLILGALGALLAFRKHHAVAGAVVGSVGAAVFVTALLSPRAALAIRAGWMALATALGWVNTRVLLGVIFFLLLTPLALVRRLVTSAPDFRSSGARGEGSYWRSRPDEYDSKHWEHPY